MPLEAVAPYNFVPLPTIVPPGNPLPSDPTAKKRGESDGQHLYHENRHTGWFDVVYRTLTPTYTRAAKGVENWKYPRPIQPTENGQPSDFFHYGDAERKPVLPGSSLRGMVRNVFEILTASKMQFVNDRTLFFRVIAARNHLENLSDMYKAKYNARTRLVAGVLRKNGQDFVLEVAPGAPHGFVVIRAQEVWHQQHLSVKHGERRSGQNYLGKGHERPQYAVLSDHGTLYVQIEAGASALLFNPGGTENELRAPIAHFCPPNDNGALPGRLILGGKDPNIRKQYAFILAPHPDPSKNRRFQLSRKHYREYEEWGESAHGHKFRDASRDVPRHLKDGDYCFALLEEDSAGNVVGAETGNISVLGANLMMPQRYQQSIGQVVRASHPDEMPEWDMTEAVFGAVREKTTERPAAQIRGRVFFEDALLDKTQDDTSPWLDKSPEPIVQVPKPLLSPKPTSMQNYLKQPPSQREEPIVLTHWNDEHARVRGFKRYWHRSANAADDNLYNESKILQERQNQNRGRNQTAEQNDKLRVTDTRMCPVRPGCKFVGRVRYENLTDVELGALYTSLFLPDGLAHRFGMGKPLGLGSLTATEWKAETRMVNIAARYRSLSSEGAFHNAEESQKRLKTAYIAFAEVARGLENPGAQGDTLWNLPRLRHIARLLACDNDIRARKDTEGKILPWSDVSSAQISIDDKNNRQWRDRHVLPDYGLVKSGSVPDLFEMAPPATDAPSAKNKTEKRAVPQAGSRLPATVHNVSQPMHKWLGDITLVGIERKPFGKEILDKEYAEGEEITVEVVIAEPNGYIRMIRIVPNP